jgi:polyisoprenoid-binding protein YceI
MKHPTQRSFALGLSLSLGLLLAVPGLSESVLYRIDASESRFTVEVGRAGLFKVFGHDHLVEVREFSGTVDWNPDAPERSSFRLEVDAASLRVADDEVSEGDRKQIESDMQTKALALGEHPTIGFESSGVVVEKSEAAAKRMRVTGTLRLRGVEKDLTIPLTLTVAGDRITAKGEVKLPSDRWGVPQISALGGSVKTNEELALAFEIVAHSEVR